MCGIAGYINKNNKQVTSSIISKMTDVIEHRGPDASGLYVHRNFGMGHRRLAILDVSDAGKQPMYSHDGKYVIAFNGEIYNFLELKGELEKLGCTFYTKTDTEMIMEAYRIWGSACTKKFNGMWAFALFDIENEHLFLSRDRFGVKPLYVLDTKNELVFASEIKSIIEVFPEQKIVDWVAVSRHVRGIQEDSDERTFYKEIKNFGRATNCIYDLSGKIRKKEVFWRLNEKKGLPDKGNPYKVFRTLFEDAVKIRLRSDVSVGASLSGGIDSSTIVSVVKKKFHKKMDTFSSVYTESECDERQYINEVVRSGESRAHYVRPTEMASNLEEDLKTIVYYHDGPCIEASPYSGFCVYRSVGDTVKVLLDGQGADELFAGYQYLYNSYLEELLEKKKKLSAIRTVASCCAGNPQAIHSIQERTLFRILGVYGYKQFAMQYGRENPREKGSKVELTEEFSKVGIELAWDIDPDINQELNRELYKLLYYSMLPRILHDVDRNSMAHSLEVRLPFLDYRLVEYAFSLDSKYKIKNSWTKYVVRRGMKKYLPKKIYSRRKKLGFPAPFSAWLRNPEINRKLLPYLECVKERNIVTPNYVDKCVSEHLSGKYDRGDVLFRLIVLEMWLEDMDTPEKKWIYRYETKG